MQLSDLMKNLTELPSSAEMAVVVGDKLYQLDRTYLLRQGGKYVTLLHTGEEIDIHAET